MITAGAFIAASIIGLVGTAAATAVSASTASNAAKRSQQSVRETNATNTANVQATNEMNYKIWQEQMAYNSPEHQIQMLDDAGLNGKAAYLAMNGAGSSVVGNVPTMEAAQDSPIIMPDSVGPTIAQGVRDATQIAKDTFTLYNEQVKTQTDVISKRVQDEYVRKQTDMVLAQTIGVEEYNDLAPERRELLARQKIEFDYNIGLLQETLAETQRVNEFNKTLRTWTLDDRKFDILLRNAQLEVTEATARKLQAEVKKCAAEARYLGTQIDAASLANRLNEVLYEDYVEQEKSRTQVAKESVKQSRAATRAADAAAYVAEETQENTVQMSDDAAKRSHVSASNFGIALDLTQQIIGTTCDMMSASSSIVTRNAQNFGYPRNYSRTGFGSFY